MLEIRDLHAAVDGQLILKGISLTVNAGEVHAVILADLAAHAFEARMAPARAHWRRCWPDIRLMKS